MKIELDPITKEPIIEYSKADDIPAKEIIETIDQAKIRRAYAGLPIYNTTSGLTQKDGEIVIIKTNSVSNRLRIRAGNINSSVSLT